MRRRRAAAAAEKAAAEKAAARRRRLGGEGGGGEGGGGGGAEKATNRASTIEAEELRLKASAAMLVTQAGRSERGGEAAKAVSHFD